jgi:hypothetical protein
MEESESKEELYICDRAEECKVNLPVECDAAEPKESFAWGIGKHFYCHASSLNARYIPYKEEKLEPKTKRVAVIAFLDVPLGADAARVEIHTEHGWHELADVEPIDPDRLRYGTPEAGEEVILPSKGIVKADPFWKDPIGLGTGREKCLIIDPPTPEPETVEDVMRDMPTTESYYGDRDPESQDGYWRDMQRWEKDLKAAKEREEA